MRGALDPKWQVLGAAGGPGVLRVLLGVLSALLASTFVAGAPSGGVPGPLRAQISEEITLFHGGTIHTGFIQRPDGAEPSRTVEALIVSGGRIVAVGDFDTLAQSELGRSAERVDLRGGHAYPGFQDAHGNLEGFGKALEIVELRGCESYEEVIRRVAAAAAELPAGEWVEGGGWDHTLWPGGEWPDHLPLTEAVPDHPVVLRRVDGRTILVNGPALMAAGLSGPAAPTEDPAGGRVLRLGERATGVLQGTAVAAVTDLIPKPSPEARKKLIRRAQQRLLEYGLTCVHDLDLDLESAGLLGELSSEGPGSLRVVGYIRADTWDSEAEFQKVQRGAGPMDRFDLRGCSFTLDGPLGSRGAALLSDYSDAKGERGLLLTDLERLTRQLRFVAGAGLQPALHAIGDRANRLALGAVAQAARSVDGFASLRPRIEHAQVVESSDLQRFGELGIIPSMQPSHVAADLRWAEDRLGKQRSRSAYAWRSLLRVKNARPMAFGSAFPAEEPNPLLGIHAVLTRQGVDGLPKSGWIPGERLSVTEALAGYTSGPAVAAAQDDRRGLLARGFFCDMTVLDTDLTDVEPSNASRVLKAKVLMTVVNGRVLFERK